MLHEARSRADAVRYMSVCPGFRGRATHGQGRDRPRTGPVGAVMLTVRPASWPLTCHFRMPAAGLAIRGMALSFPITQACTIWRARYPLGPWPGGSLRISDAGHIAGSP
jgi:hypothetical protein